MAIPVSLWWPHPDQTHNCQPHHYTHEKLALEAIEWLLDRKVELIMAEFDNLKAAVAKLTSQDDALLSLVQNLKDKAAAGTVTQADIQALEDTLNSETAKVSNALSDASGGTTAPSTDNTTPTDSNQNPAPDPSTTVTGSADTSGTTTDSGDPNTTSPNDPSANPVDPSTDANAPGTPTDPETGQAADPNAPTA